MSKQRNSCADCAIQNSACVCVCVWVHVRMCVCVSARVPKEVKVKFCHEDATKHLAADE